MSEWDNYCDEIGGVCKDMEAQAARIAELEAERDREWHDLDELFEGYCKEHPDEKIGIKRFLAVVRNTRVVNEIRNKGKCQIVFLDVNQ